MPAGAVPEIILFNFKRKEDDSEGRNRPMKINLAKNRHGIGGSYEMYFCGRQFKFSETPFVHPPIPAAAPNESQRPSSIPAPPVISDTTKPYPPLIVLTQSNDDNLNYGSRIPFRLRDVVLFL